MKYLGVTPGSVSPFGLINDHDRRVRVFLDRDLATADRVSFHPNINTVTLDADAATRTVDTRRFCAGLAEQSGALRSDHRPERGRLLSRV